MTQAAGNNSAGRDPEQEPVVIRDKRKLRPNGGEEAGSTEPASSADAAGTAGSTGSPGAAGSIGGGEDARLLAERTADLQRLQAEFANYRRRAERERLAAGDLAVGGVFAALLPVLDDIDRARAHGDLTGALKSVADGLDAVLGKFGLQRFGDVGDPFDPTIHEAVTHDERDDVAVTTATMVMRPGYRMGERLLRPAMVGVSEPTSGSPAVPDAAQPSVADVHGSGAAGHADVQEQAEAVTADSDEAFGATPTAASAKNAPPHDEPSTGTSDGTA